MSREFRKSFSHDTPGSSEGGRQNHNRSLARTVKTGRTIVVPMPWDALFWAYGLWRNYSQEGVLDFAKQCQTRCGWDADGTSLLSTQSPTICSQPHWNQRPIILPLSSLGYWKVFRRRYRCPHRMGDETYTAVRVGYHEGIFAVQSRIVPNENVLMKVANF